MAPRFATSHLATHNRAINGVRKSFTSLRDEFLFIDENTRGILELSARRRCARAHRAHRRVQPGADVLFAAAKARLSDVIRFNERLFAKLDIERFFFCVRPYYKPYRVGRQDYRGANAGDFSGINEIDLLLGLCRASDPYYASCWSTRCLHAAVRPGAAARVHDAHAACSTSCSSSSTSTRAPTGSGERARVSRGVRPLRGDARAAPRRARLALHRGPAAKLPKSAQEGITASGPPLPVLIRSLELLRDFRTACRNEGLQRLRKATE